MFKWQLYYTGRSYIIYTKIYCHTFRSRSENLVRYIS